jgi:hypothetical protein
MMSYRAVGESLYGHDTLHDTMAATQLGWILAIALAVGLGLVVAWLLARRNLHKREQVVPTLWCLSLGVSLVFALGIAAIWVLVATLPATPTVGAPLLSTADLATYLQTYAASGQPAPLVVPTGLFVQALGFTDAQDVTVSGVLWQRYAPDLPAGVKRGFLLPTATSLSTTDLYDSTDAGGTEVIGWQFKAVVREQLSVGAYPLDQQDLALPVRPAEVVRNVVLSPDFAAYTTLAPTALAPLARHVGLGDWYPVQSYFTYLTSPVLTTFGVPTRVDQSRYPTLDLTVSVRRHVPGTIVNHLLPALATAVVLFFVVMVTTRELERRDQFGWKVANVLGACSALLFTIVFAHIALRTAVGAEGALYLGYFYSVLYALIVLAILNAVLLVARPQWTWLSAADNLVAKTLYWPAYLGILFLLTLLQFV